MTYEKPIIQSVQMPFSVTAKQQFTILVSVIDGELITTIYAGEVHSGETNGG